MPVKAPISNKTAINRVKADVDHIQRKVLDTGKLIKWLGPKVRDMVGNRTKGRGIDANEEPFVAYSDEYAKRKKGGRKLPVTLVDDGEMMSLLDFKSTGQASGKVYVRTGGSPNRAAVAAAHHRGQGVPKREWLGLSPSDLRILERDVLLYLEKQMDYLLGPGFSDKRTAFRKVGPNAFKKKGAKVLVYTGHAK